MEGRRQRRGGEGVGELAKGGGRKEGRGGGLAGLMRGGAGSKAASASGSLHYDEETGREVKSPGTDRDAKKSRELPAPLLHTFPGHGVYKMS